MRLDLAKLAAPIGVVLAGGFQRCAAIAPPAPGGGALAGTRAADGIGSAPETDRLRAQAGGAREPFFAPDLGAIETGGAGHPHTLERHVGRPPAMLRARARAHHQNASSYPDLATAQRTVAAAFAPPSNQARIAGWLAAPRANNLVLHIDTGAPLGIVARFPEGDVVNTSSALVVLKKTPTLSPGFIVLTSYPVPTERMR